MAWAKATGIGAGSRETKSHGTGHPGTDKCFEESLLERGGEGQSGSWKRRSVEREFLKMLEVTAGVCRDRQDPMGGN